MNSACNSSALLTLKRPAELDGPVLQTLSNGAAGPQEPDPDGRGGGPLFSRDLLGGQAAQLMLKEDAIRGAAEFEYLGGIHLHGMGGSHIHSDVDAEIGQGPVSGLVLEPAAMVVDRDGADPAYNHPFIPELIDLPPSLQPGGLSGILGVVHRSAARKQ